MDSHLPKLPNGRSPKPDPHTHIEVCTYIHIYIHTSPLTAHAHSSSSSSIRRLQLHLNSQKSPVFWVPTPGGVLRIPCGQHSAPAKINSAPMSGYVCFLWGKGSFWGVLSWGGWLGWLGWLVRWVLPLQVLAFGLELQVEVEVELGQPDATLKRCAMPMKMRQMGWFRVV